MRIGIGIGLGFMGGGAASAYAAYALAFDPKGEEYWVSGTRYGATEGPELMPDPEMNSATGASLFGGATISGGNLNIPAPDGVVARFSIAGGVANSLMTVVVEVTAGTTFLQIGNGSSGFGIDGQVQMTLGTNTVTWVCSNPTATLTITNGPTGGGACTISRISVKRKAGVNQLPGYTFTRSGAKGERNALASGDVIDSFATNEPAIVPGVGYWSRGALTNNLLWGQAFDNVAWSKTNSSVTANTDVAPDGTLTMDTLTTSGAAAAQYVAQATTNAALCTFSVFAKQGTGRYLQLSHGNAGNYVNFDLQTGTVGTSNLATGYIIDCGGGIYRCVMVFTPGGQQIMTIAQVTASNSTYNAAFTATVATVKIWQAQVIEGNLPDGGPIIVTGAAALAVGADDLRLASYVTTDVDQWFECVIDLVGTNNGPNLFRYTVDANNYFTVSLGVVPGLVVLFGGAVVINNSSGGDALPQGKLVVIVRRLSGAWSIARRASDGNATSAELAGGFPVGSGAFAIGNSLGAMSLCTHRVGTLSNADRTARLLELRGS